MHWCLRRQCSLNFEHKLQWGYGNIPCAVLKHEVFLQERNWMYSSTGVSKTPWKGKRWQTSVESTILFGSKNPWIEMAPWSQWLRQPLPNSKSFSVPPSSNSSSSSTLRKNSSLSAIVCQMESYRQSHFQGVWKEQRAAGRSGWRLPHPLVLIKDRI